jgi:hypothetical protein
MECSGDPFLVQRSGSRTLPEKLSVCRLPLVADGLALLPSRGFSLFVGAPPRGMEVQLLNISPGDNGNEDNSRKTGLGIA